MTPSESRKDIPQQIDEITEWLNGQYEIYYPKKPEVKFTAIPKDQYDAMKAEILRLQASQSGQDREGMPRETLFNILKMGRDGMSDKYLKDWLDEFYPETTTPESQWPTAEEIEKAFKKWLDSVKYYTHVESWKACAQWLQTSGVREPSKEPRQSYNDLHDERDGLKIQLGSVRALTSKLNNIIIELNEREGELEKCLGEFIELCESLVKSIGYECVETTEIKSLVTKAKSLLNTDKRNKI